MKSIAMCFLQDDKGNYSHARLIALLVGFSATFFMWKLMLLGEMTTDYFLYYLAYGVVHQSVNKFLDVAGAWVGLRRPAGDPGEGKKD